MIGTRRGSSSMLKSKKKKRKLKIIQDVEVNQEKQQHSGKTKNGKLISKVKHTISNLTPIAEERVRLDLNGLFDKGKGKRSQESKVKPVIYDDVDDDDDFFDDMPLSMRRSILSNTSKSIGIVDLRKEVKVVSANQMRLCTEIKELKFFIEVKFSQVMDIISAAINQKEGDRAGRSEACLKFDELVDHEVGNKEDEDLNSYGAKKINDNVVPKNVCNLVDELKNDFAIKNTDEKDSMRDSEELRACTKTHDLVVKDEDSKIETMEDGSSSCFIDTIDINILVDAVDAAELSYKKTESNVSRLFTPPVILKRQIKPANILMSPYVTKYGSSDEPVRIFSHIDIVQGIFPFDDKIGQDIDFRILEEFHYWIDKRAQGGKKRPKVYTEEDNSISPAFHFGVATIAEKFWFHSLVYAGGPFSESHIDVIFYYLRKKGKYSNSVKLIFTTTDNLFDQNIQMLYSLYLMRKRDLSVCEADHLVAKYIRGCRMLCNMPWYKVDHVLFPIHVSKKKKSTSKHIDHWILGRLSFKDRCIYVYDTMRSSRNDKIVLDVVQAYSTLLPRFLVVENFYSLRTELDLSRPPYLGKLYDDPFNVVHVDGLPIQQESIFCSDCGLYAVSFAEYLIDGKEIPCSDFDVEIHRNRIAFSLYEYGKRKHVEHIESERE